MVLKGTKQKSPASAKVRSCETAGPHSLQRQSPRNSGGRRSSSPSQSDSPLWPRPQSPLPLRPSQSAPACLSGSIALFRGPLRKAARLKSPLLVPARPLPSPAPPARPARPPLTIRAPLPATRLLGPRGARARCLATDATPGLRVGARTEKAPALFQEALLSLGWVGAGRGGSDGWSLGVAQDSPRGRAGAGSRPGPGRLPAPPPLSGEPRGTCRVGTWTRAGEPARAPQVHGCRVKQCIACPVKFGFQINELLFSTNVVSDTVIRCLSEIHI